ncbi:MAG: alpha/beta hydrolase-fold protein [Oscillospiraceae bacterium]|nr:alpha/beta hydrolase-fold protein [Oscillospiraceae bacterium]
MEMQYFKQYSHSLGREMECKVYGHSGRPVLFIPCQDGRFFDFENYRMANVWDPWIESGQVMVFAVDTVDQETWSNKNGDPAWRSWRHEQWMHYLMDEIPYFIRDMVNSRNGWDGQPGIIAFGCSLGATHAANLFFRRPDLYTGLLALSGIYTAEYGFGDYMDEWVYKNSPVHYLANMPADHPYVSWYGRNKGIICVGQGPWELPESTHRLKEIFREKGIDIWVDFWGFDCSHDWPWWYKQVEYFAPKLLG